MTAGPSLPEPALRSHRRHQEGSPRRHGSGGDGTPCDRAPLPSPEDDWRDWFADNTRSFRRTLLMRRDGARLHACSTPTGDLDRIRRKMDFLIASGIPERDAQMAMPAA
ncbi:TetR/AcrR family transcriptional regulator C-terminal domain-containing protein [Streptomyces violascens]|uniref:TetR/AcrR family transcriptional regulator C-terminal domain-containing protein n=1 Tax=Streptomyces violascens TaxID=67381 RepID=UPI003695F748